MIEFLQDYLDQIVASGTGAVVALGALLVVVALAMALQGLRS